METDRYQRGLDIMNEITVTDNKEIGTHSDIIAAFKDIAPDLESYIVEFAFGIFIQERAQLHNKKRLPQSLHL